MARVMVMFRVMFRVWIGAKAGASFSVRLSLG